MALNLDGSYEQIKFHDYESVLLYNNTQYETYEPHWHASTEIIMPLTGMMISVDACQCGSYVSYCVLLYNNTDS